MFAVAVLTPMYNAEPFLNDTIASVAAAARCLAQPVQWVVYDDASKDQGPQLLVDNRGALLEAGVHLVLSSGHPDADVVRCNDVELPRGCGFGKNRCVELAKSAFLCFHDADDVMCAGRLTQQLGLCRKHPNAIVGSNFTRLPPNSTERYAAWLNSLSDQELITHRFRENTLAMPTWFMQRAVFDKVGGFDEGPPGTPEDMIFFYRHLELGGELRKVHEPLIVYRYHPNSQHLGVPSQVILGLRVAVLEKQVLCNWPTFSIWGAGKEGRKIFKALSETSKAKVRCFLDISPKLIGNTVTTHRLPVVHFSEGVPPVLTAVKLGFTDGEFEANLRRTGWREGTDFVLFA